MRFKDFAFASHVDAIDGGVGSTLTVSLSCYGKNIYQLVLTGEEDLLRAVAVDVPQQPNDEAAWDEKVRRGKLFPENEGELVQKTGASVGLVAAFATIAYASGAGREVDIYFGTPNEDGWLDVSHSQCWRTKPGDFRGVEANVVFGAQCFYAELYGCAERPPVFALEAHVKALALH